MIFDQGARRFDEAAQRRAELQRHQRLHRRRRPEELRAQGRHQRPGFHRGNPFPQLAIGEYKVITSNYKAEFDQISSAAITAVTKSGTNEFARLGVLRPHRPITGARRTPRKNDAGEEVRYRDVQYGMSLGGPILQDRLLFFFTYEGKDIDVAASVTLGRQLHRPAARGPPG